MLLRSKGRNGTIKNLNREPNGSLLNYIGENMKVKKIGIVSLSSGMMGEDFLKHNVDIGLNRLKKYGVEIKFMPNSLKGIDFIKNNPKARAQDLLDAMLDDSIDMILCAIGGEDTYRLLPYLFDNNELQKAASQKIFLGFSDTTMNHFMLHKLGIKTFYGQAFLPDVCELSKDMLPYSKQYFEELLNTGSIKEIRPSEVWYSERKDFSEKSIGVAMPCHKNNGFELLKGKAIFTGQILGGCIDSIYTIFDNSRFDDTVSICNKYSIFPSLTEWENKILLLETSEEKPTPELYKKMIQALKNYGIFDVVSAVLIGEPQDEVYFDEYKKILLDELADKSLSIVCNINVGHATPRCIIPFGVDCEVNTIEQKITFNY